MNELQILFFRPSSHIFISFQHPKLCHDFFQFNKLFHIVPPLVLMVDLFPDVTFFHDFV